MMEAVRTNRPDPGPASKSICPMDIGCGRYQVGHVLKRMFHLAMDLEETKANPRRLIGSDLRGPI